MAATTERRPDGDGGERWRAWLPGLGLLALVLVVYLPATRCGFIWDDDDYVVNNPLLRDLDGLRRIWLEPGASEGRVQYYPLVSTSFWLEHHLWGLAPAGYHLVNVLVHGLSAVALWRLLGFLRVPGAWLGAALFALHPVQVESVAWITERKNVLSCLFYVLAALAYLRWEGAGGEPRRGPWRRYALALGLFVLALLSKTVTASLPAALLVVLWWRRGRLGRREVLPTLPFFAVGVALGLATIWFERTHVGAAGAAFDLSPVDRLLVAGRALWFYMAKLAWPSDLVFIYPRWTIDSGAAWQYVFPLGFLALVAALFLLRGRIGRGPVSAVCLFAGTLVPALGFVDVYPFLYSFVADHFQYHATIGLLALFGAGGALLARRAPGLGWGPAAVVLAVLGTLTWRRQAAYVDLEALWSDTARRNPGAWIAHTNLGSLLAGRGEVHAAIASFERAIAADPRCVTARVALGNLRTTLGEVASALPHYEAALAALPDYDDPAITRLELFERRRADRFLGRALRVLGRCEEALPHLEAAAAREPADVGEQYDLAVCLYRLRRIPEAVARYERALALDPTAPQTLRDLAGLLATEPEVRDPARALELARRAVELGGEEDVPSLNALAAAHAANGDYARAADVAQRALALAEAAGAAGLANVLRASLERYRAASSR